MKKHKVVWIEWLDSEDPHEYNWIEESEIEITEDDHLCVSCGLVIDENDKYIWITHSKDPENERTCGWFKIPKVAIVKIERYLK